MLLLELVLENAETEARAREAFACRQCEPFANQSPQAVFVALGEEVVGNSLVILF